MSGKAQDCVCGYRNVAWGSDRMESGSFLHCTKCNRYVKAGTLAAIEKWNSPAKIAWIETASSGRVGFGIY